MSYQRMICLVLAVLLLAGCGVQGGQTTAPTAEESAATTVPAEQETTQTTEPALIELGDVNLLTVRSFCATPAVTVLDERTVAFLTTEYDREKGITVTHLAVLDLYTDTMLAEKTVDTALSLPVQSVLPGVLPVFDISGDEWLVLDRQLEEISRFSCDESGGVFNADMSVYYYISAQRLCSLELATGATAVVETELTLPVDSIADYRMEDNVALLNVHTQYYLTDLCLGAVDLDDGTLLALTDEGQKGFFSEDGLLLQGGESVTTSDLIRTDWAGEQGMMLTDIMPSDSVYRSWCIPMSDYHLTLYYDSRNAYSLSSFQLWRYGVAYESCELYDLTDGLEPDKLVSLPGGRLLAVDYSRRGTKLALISPEELTFTPAEQTPEAYTLTMVDDAIPESYAEQSAPVELPEELAEVRATADALEEQYKITILLSAQCDSIIEQCGFELQPTDKAGLKDEAVRLRAALRELEESLALYPEGFFPQFRNEADERGILVLLVENISAGIDDDNVDVLGVTYDMGDWYPIAVDVTTADLPATYCHEIWHAMENKIMDEDPMLFNDVMWGRLNPSGFSYKGVVEGYYNDTEYTYLDSDAGTESYFVDSYGKTKPQEDRARLMEYIMTSDYTAKKMMEAPVLYEKMQIMVDAVREIFQTDGWENVLWERFHTS